MSQRPSKEAYAACLTRLHEVSSVKVPRPASPFITHETPMLIGGTAVAVSRGKGRD